jgi:hypothetical protein
MEQILFNGFCNNVDFPAVKDILKRSIVCLSMVEQGKADEIFYNLRMPVIPYGNDPLTVEGMVPGMPLVIPTFKVFRAPINIDLAIWPEMDTFTVGTGVFDGAAQERNPNTGYNGVAVAGAVADGLGNTYFPNAKRRQAGILVSGANTQQARPPFGGLSVMSYPQATAGQQNVQNKPVFFSIGYWELTGTPEQIDSKLF